jgi:hypothetical protein
MKFFGWTWVAAAFADDDIGQSGRYSFAQLSESGLDFPCFYIIGTQNNAGLSALSSCIQNYTDIKVLLLWGSKEAVQNSIRYLYSNTNLSYLTFVINPTAAVAVNFNILAVPSEFYQGSIFLSENYDEETGFYDCIERFLDDPSSASEAARKVYETEYGCVLTSDPNLPLCKNIINDESNGKCKCILDNFRDISRPYTV